MNLGKFREKIKLYAPNESVNAFGETALVSYVQKIVAYAKRRDIEWSTIGEEVHGKQLVVEARTEFYIKKFRPEIKENWVVVYDGTTYEITRVDEFKNGEYTRILALRRDNFAPELLLSNPVFMLDTHSGATMAFSVRRLNTLYTGPAMRVRRESDDQELDIPFTTSGDLNTDILEEFCEGTDGWVKVWRDQSGNGYDATETNHTKQPQIVDNGVIKRNGDGEICIFFETHNRRFLDIGPELDTAPHSAFVLAERYPGTNESGQDRRGIYGFGDAVNELNFQYKRFDLNFWETYLGYTFIGNGIQNTAINSHTDLSNQPRLFSSRYDGATYNLHVGSMEKREYSIKHTSSGRISLAHRNHSDINMSEFVLYTSFVQDSTREAIETNINDYYGLWSLFDGGLLDTHTGPVMAFGLRRLNTNYTGPCIQVQAHNNDVFDVGFDLEGNLLLDKIRYKVGSSENSLGKVKKWYDQSGNSNDLVQTDVDLMATITSLGGTIHKDEDGHVYVDCTSAQYFSPLDVDKPWTVVTTLHQGGTERIMQGGIFWSPTGYYNQRLNTGGNQINGIQEYREGHKHVCVAIVDDTNASLRLDGALDAQGSSGSNDLTTLTTFLTQTGSKPISPNGTERAYEFVLYPSDKSSVIQAIETDMAKHYNVDGPVKPLDSSMASNAVGAYSLRKLKSDYQGSAIRVRHSQSMITDHTDPSFTHWAGRENSGLYSFIGEDESRLGPSSYPYHIHGGYGEPDLYVNGNQQATSTGDPNTGWVTRDDIYDYLSGHKLQVYQGARTNEPGAATWEIFVLEGYSSTNAAGGLRYDGKIQEIILFNQDNSSNRVNLETNMNHYHGLWRQFTGAIVPIASNDNAAAAYSLRRIRSGWTGAAVELRRSNGDTQDIGFDLEGNFDIGAAMIFCDGGAGTVVRWYDQTGNNRHAIASTSAGGSISEARQPTLVDNTGHVFTDSNGRARIRFNGVDDGLSYDSTVFSLDSVSSFVVGQFVDQEDGQMMFGLSGPVDPGIGSARFYNTYMHQNKFKYGYANTLTTQADANTNLNLHTHIAGSTLGNAEAFLNGSSVGTQTLSSLSANSSSGIGMQNNDFFADCHIQEVILYDNDQSSNRTTIEGNINNYYQIY
jgi:hypothetical protein